MRNKNAGKGFTLIELLVVVAIIVVLISILMPALGMAKNKARVASTSALESQIRGAIEGYYTTFNAYPGPGSATDTAGQSAKVLSGAQNLLLGLSYAMNPLPAPNGTAVKVALGGVSTNIYPTFPNGPINYAARNPLFPAQGQQLSAFFAVSPKNISPPSNGPWAAGGVPGISTASTVSNNFDFPVIIDTFTDGLPILYYRRTPGIDTTNAFAPADAYDPTKPNSLQAFYGLENAEYTGSAGNPPRLVASSGSVFQQGLGTPKLNGQSIINYNCTGSYSAAPPSGVPVHGGYMLISAGIDRIYGIPANSKTSDDLVLIGGD